MQAASRIVLSSFAVLMCLAAIGRTEEMNILADPSFEMPGERDQFGHVFPKWGGWKYEGDCEFRVGRVAHSGKSSCLLYSASSPKIRISQDVDLEPGRYRITAWLRGLDLGAGTYNNSSEFMFDSK